VAFASVCERLRAFASVCADDSAPTPIFRICVCERTGGAGRAGRGERKKRETGRYFDIRLIAVAELTAKTAVFCGRFAFVV